MYVENSNGLLTRQHLHNILKFHIVKVFPEWGLLLISLEVLMELTVSVLALKVSIVSSRKRQPLHDILLQYCFL